MEHKNTSKRLEIEENKQIKESNIKADEAYNLKKKENNERVNI